MRIGFVNSLAASALLAGSGAVSAHHSISMFEIENPIWVSGTVVRFQAINPHAVIVVDVTGEDGAVERWTVEGPTLRRLERMNAGSDFLLADDIVEVCGFPPKAQFSSERPSLNTVGYAARVFHGHVLVMPSGDMRHFGPYGKIENCVRPDDRVSEWVDFLDSDPLALEAWCGSRGLNWAESLPPQSFVDEVNSRIANPCE